MDENREVIKHSAAIHIQNSITLLQRRAWTVLLYNAYNTLLSEEEYCIAIKELAGILEFESKNADYLKEALRALTTCGIEWNVLEKDSDPEWGVTTLLAHAKIKNGMLTYSYSLPLRKRLYNPRMYARISLSMQNKFSSKHALALWELCVDYLDVVRNYGETQFIPLVTYRKLMGMSDDMYPKFKDLSKYVIKAPIEEINRVTDFHVEVNYKRERRKVVAIKFKVRRELALPHYDAKQNTLFPDLDDTPVAVKVLKDAGLSADDAWKIWQDGFSAVDAGKRPADIEDNPEAAFTQYVREKVHLLKRLKDQGKVTNATGFLLKAIKQNYGNPEFAEDERRSSEWKAMAAKQEERKQLEREKMQLEGAYSDACEAIYAAILQDDPDVLAGLIQAAIKTNPFLRRYCEGDTPKEQYRKSMVLAPAVHALMKERYPDRFRAINEDYQPRLNALDSQIAALK